jgi:HD-GYP domain-containing protein (c-di-GMP phosphodiesterase class II)
MEALEKDNEVRASIQGLKIGMYVSRLDQPWLGTPFPLQGVMINSPDDIEELKKYCDYVYIDVERGPSPSAKYLAPLGGDIKSGPEGPKAPNFTLGIDPDDKKRINRVRYEVTAPFNEEIPKANKIYDKVAHELEKVILDLEEHKEVDLSIVREGISDMVHSIVKNPAAMMWMVQMRKLDKYTYTRSLSTSVWCATFGRHLGMEISDIETLALGGLLLDLGKSGLPLDLLRSHGELSQEQREVMETHVDLGIKILASTAKSSPNGRIPMDLLQMIATHHERYDGSGYPQKMRHEEIPLFGQIAGIADSFDAMTTDRPYVENGAFSPHQAISELYSLKETHFQADLIDAFIQTVGIFPVGSLVELNTGEVGAVVSNNKQHRLRPTLVLFLDEEKNNISPLRYINLAQMDESLYIAHGLPAGAHGIEMEEVFLTW